MSDKQTLWGAKAKSSTWSYCKLYWFLCKTQRMSNLREATNPKHIRFIHWMPLLIIWSHLGKTLNDYLQHRPSMNLCHADSNSTLGGRILHPSTRQDVKTSAHRGNGCAAVTQIPGSESNLCCWGRVTKADCPELSQQPLSSEVCSQHDEGKRTISGIHIINCLYSKTDSRGSVRKSTVFEFKEMGSDTQQLWDVFLGVGYHPVPEMKV